MNSQPNRIREGGLVDRTNTLRFSFEGEALTGHPGDTLASALLANGVAIAERLRVAVERCRLPRKAGTNWFTISAGVVQASEGDDMRRILQRVRAALTSAENQGRNCVVGNNSFGLRTDESPVPVS